MKKRILLFLLTQPSPAREGFRRELLLLNPLLLERAG
jgi:hypothetical protein